MPTSRHALRGDLRELPIGRALLAVCAVALVAVPASAQDTEKEAAKLVRKATKEQAKQFKTTLSEELEVLNLRLAAFTDEVKAGDYSASGFLDLLDDVEEFQAGTAVAITDALNGVGQAMAIGLLGLDAAGLLDTSRPDSLSDGGREPQRIREQLARLLDKAYAKLDRKLSNLAKEMESEAGVGMIHRLLPPVPNSTSVVYLNGSATFFVPELTIDLLVAFSALDVTDDGWVRASGQANTIAGNVTLAFFPSPVAPQDVTVDGGARRWTSTTSGHDERNVIVRVSQDGGPEVPTTIGLR